MVGGPIFKTTANEFFASAFAGECKYLRSEVLNLRSQAITIEVLLSENGVRTRYRLRQIRQAQSKLRD